MQIVFLFDLNSFNDESGASTKDLPRQLLCLRVACLRILTQYSTTVSNLKWGFKFFDSKGSLTQSMQNFSFPNVSLESFEILENEICTKYQRHISYLDALAAASNHNTTILNEGDNLDYNTSKKVIHPVQILHLALTQILYEYQWNDCIDLFSPSIRKRTHSSIKKKNLLFFVSKCASNADQFQAYFGVECSSLTVSKFTNILLSSSLNKQLLDKASILWIWLNTSEDNFLGNSKPSSLIIIANTLTSLKCSLIPLSVLSKLNYILKLKSEPVEKELLQSDVSCSSLVPFSSTFSQSISYPFYLERQAPTVEAEVHITNNNHLTFPVLVSQVPLLWNRKIGHLYQELNADKKETKSPPMQMDANQNIPTVWKKFTAQFVIERHVQLKTDKMFLLLPRITNNLSSLHSIKDLVKSLMLKNVNLFIICESVEGSRVPAVLNPLSESSAIISIMDPNAYFPNLSDFPKSIGESFENFNFSELKNSLLMTKTCDTLIHENSDVKPFGDSSNSNLKSFQMECTEPWFESTSAVCSALPKIIQPPKSASEMLTFRDKLGRFYKDCKNQKKGATEIVEKEFPVVKVCPDQTEKELDEMEELYKDINYEELISILNQTYDVALKNGNVLHSAKKIIKLASNFFFKKSIISYEESMKNFMQEYFCLTCRKVIEKYKSDLDEDASTKKVNECQLQAILALEMEVLFPSAEASVCADNVRSFLGVLSFNSTPTEHNKFLCEVLKENYIDKLYDILLEIGDELMMPEEDSVESGNEDNVMSDPLGSVASSTMSVRSNSSTSSRGGNRKLIKKRSDISDTNKSRQVLLPAKSPKRKKAKSSFISENNPIRYSPRLASKKKKSKYKTVDTKPETARRNLFPKGQKPHTPRTSSVRTPKKKKSQTPKTHHVLKTNFVPETPSYKQNQSALQRRKSQMDITSPNLEVAESPVIAKNSTGSRILDRLQKLKENKMSSNPRPEFQAPSAASCSFQPLRTPESKRRLSLKLFSKMLTSPTARLGLKKCSKRLFDQISPRVFSMPAKKMKLEDNIPGANASESSNQEAHTPKKWHPIR
ncbi:hypothetical protein JTE90_027298 [Oedothorax gibbosus]|uniref:Treslin n=1 Tax=Oedothorax gibbosus TaxID=931172 RepID=A0AAV6W101_9ARAC|nr:hypothetical protein JTE90_027298 [Oedothorax gibbosus]